MANEPEIIGQSDTRSVASNNKLSVEFHFPSPVYWIDKPEFLKTAKFVAKEYLNQAKKDKPKDKLMDKLFPVTMSSSFAHDERVRDLVLYIAQTSWNILSEQGFDMRNQEVYMMDFWAQEHHLRSANEEHVHGFGAQMTGFYILDAPENSSFIAVHDPRPAKRQINLPELDMSKITPASLSANYVPKAGTLYFLNTWLPHAFTRHGSEKPMNFIHFNLGTRWLPPAPVNNDTTPPVEIV
jgi:hypothetical protein